MIKLLYPIDGSVVTQVFGARPTAYKPYKGHMGIDWRAKYVKGRASNEGKVRYGSNPGGYGTYMDIVHPEGWFTRYGHLDKYLVPNGAYVQAGQFCYVTGNTGNSTAPHLHHGFMPVNPNKNNGYGGFIDQMSYYTNNLNPGGNPVNPLSQPLSAIPESEFNKINDIVYINYAGWTEQVYNPRQKAAGKPAAFQEAKNAYPNATLGQYINQKWVIEKNVEEMRKTARKLLDNPASGGQVDTTAIIAKANEIIKIASVSK